MDVDYYDGRDESEHILPQSVPFNSDMNDIHEPNDEHQIEVTVPFSNPEVSLERAIVNLEPNLIQPESLDHNYVALPSSISSADERMPSVMDSTDESNCYDGISKTEEKNKNKTTSSECEDEGDLCPICLDNWTVSGEHRICALKCGHLFGYKCVKRWLEHQPTRPCPTCKKKVRKIDIRFIYARKLVAVDTAELDSMKKQLEMAVEEKNQVMIDISKHVCREHILTQEIENLKRQIEEMKNLDLPSKSVTNGDFPNTYTKTVRLFMDKSLEVCQHSGCRVFDVGSFTDLIVASAKSPNGLFSGFGIRKFHISSYKSLAYIPLHRNQIRDVCFHPVNNWVLTASLDKSFKVVDLNTNNVSCTSSETMPLWSCCWDKSNQNMIYVGTQTGDVVKYDIRMLTNGPVSTCSVPGDMSPVVSVASIPSGHMADLGNGGIISCKLNSLWVFENFESDYKRHSLPIEGPFISMKYNSTMKQILISTRPNNRISYSRHTLCTLEKSKSDDGVQCKFIHTFQGGGMQKLLSKSCFVTNKQDYVAAYQESSKSVFLWSINSGQRVCSVPAHEPILDLGSVQNQNGSFLVSLTEKKLEFFKFS